MAVDLEQSPFLNVLPDQKVRRTLKLMGRPADDRITSDVAREIAQRNAVKAILAGSITSLGSHYVISLDVTNAATGESIAQEQMEAASKEQVLDALGKAVRGLRGKLGESLASLQKFDKPLSEATTSSLEALKALTMADDKHTRGDEFGAVPLYQHAIELDPNFGYAYARLGATYGNLGEAKLSRDNIAKAFALKDRVSERERLYIAGHYWSRVAGDVPKAIEDYELYKQTYPRDSVAYNNVGIFYQRLEEHDKALENFLKSVELAPDTANGYTNAADVYQAQGRFDEAKAIVAQWSKRLGDSPNVHVQLSSIAAAQHDVAAFERELETIKKVDPTWIAVATALQADMAAAHGRLKQARELYGSASEGAHRVKFEENAAQWMLGALDAESVLGVRRPVRAEVDKALALSSSDDVRGHAAIIMLVMGQEQPALQWFELIARNAPQDTFVQNVYLPLAHAIVALNHGDAQRACDALKQAEPYDKTAPNVHYARGLALLKLNQPAEAARQFNAALDLSNAQPLNFLWGPARVGLGRAYAAQGDKAKARTAYQDALALWKDADAGLPLVEQAKQELAKLQ